MLTNLNIEHNFSHSLSLPSKDIFRNPIFRSLCKRLKYLAPSLHGSDIISMIKVLHALDVETNTDIFMALLGLIQTHVTDLSLDNIMFTDFMLSKQQKLPIVESLQFAMPIIFQIRLAQEMDHENLPKLLEYFTYVANNAKAIGRKSVTNIVAGVALNSAELTNTEAKGVIWHLTKFRHFEPVYQVLLANCFRIISGTIDEIDKKELKVLQWRVIECITHNDAFYSQEFFDRSVERFIQEDVGLSEALNVVNQLRRIVSIHIVIESFRALENQILNLMFLFLPELH